MSQQLGMDATAVRSIADQMDRIAADIRQITTSVDDAVHGMSAEWLGDDAAQLVQVWQHRHRTCLTALADQLTSMTSTARHNATEQDHASAAETGTAGVGLAASGVVAIDRFNNQVKRVTQFTGFPDIVKRWDGILHRLTPTDRLAHRVDHEWKVLSKPVSEIPHAAALKHLVGKFNDVATAIDVETHGVDAVRDFRDDHYDTGVHDLLAGTSSALKAGGPVTYLGGVVVSEWTDVVDSARQIDWHQGIPAPTPSNLVHVYAPAFGESMKSIPSRIWKWAT